MMKRQVGRKARANRYRAENFNQRSWKLPVISNCHHYEGHCGGENGEKAKIAGWGQTWVPKYGATEDCEQLTNVIEVFPPRTHVYNYTPKNT